MYKIISIIIIYLLYKIGFIGKLISVSMPFLCGFILAYLFNPIFIKLNKKIPKYLSIILVILFIVLFILSILFILFPFILKEGVDLILVITNYLLSLSTKYNINIDIFISKINDLINYTHIIEGISISIGFIAKTFLTIICFIYMTYYMDKINVFLYKLSPKLVDYLKYINNDLNKYIGSLIKLSIITFIEYSLVFFIIGHNNPLFIGFIAGIFNMVPYIGGMLTVFITILITPSMIVKICVTYMILGLIDAYLITPYIYGKYNKINPLLGLFALAVGGIFKFKGIILSFPILIIIISTYNYLKENDIKLCKNDT